MICESRMQFTIDMGESIPTLSETVSQGRAARHLTATYREHILKGLGFRDG